MLENAYFVYALALFAALLHSIAWWLFFYGLRDSQTLLQTAGDGSKINVTEHPGERIVTEYLRVRTVMERPHERDAMERPYEHDEMERPHERDVMYTHKSTNYEYPWIAVTAGSSMAIILAHRTKQPKLFIPFLTFNGSTAILLIVLALEHVVDARRRDEPYAWKGEHVVTGKALRSSAGKSSITGSEFGMFYVWE